VTLPLTRSPAVRPPLSGADFAADALAHEPAPRSRRDVRIVTVPAPVNRPEALLELLPTGDGFLWAPPTGPAIAGAGVAFGIRASGRRRFEEVERIAGELWPALAELRHPAVDAPAPRLYGGFAFAAGAASEAPWSSFGDADFALPRWSYGTDGTSAWLSLAVTGWDDPEVRGGVAGAIGALLIGLARVELRPAAGATAFERAPEDPALWRRQVEAIRRAIVKQRCEKVVAARSSALTLAEPSRPTAVLARLADSHGDCFRFGFRRGDAWFVGATPEQLIRRRGDRVETEALAGTARAGEAGALLASRKDRGEQQPVVSAIRDTLAPLCRELDVPAEPKVRALPGVLHLQTPIRGILSRPTHVLELAAALHPTPAVGGFPTEAALAWIADHEPEGRGWYAAPVGWFDARGDGELAVAIRSGVLRGDRAHLYAGAGIVRDSDPDAELAETRLKLRALEQALGVAG
jgi:isochorismate synthase